MQVEKRRVLLVDDDEALRGLGYAMLTRLGYDVVACTRSPDALETFAAAPERFDLVVTDYTMPSLTGAQLVAACSSRTSSPRWRSTPRGMALGVSDWTPWSLLRGALACLPSVHHPQKSGL